MTLRWPSVTGSNEPVYTAKREAEWVMGEQRSEIRGQTSKFVDHPVDFFAHVVAVRTDSHAAGAAANNDPGGFQFSADVVGIVAGKLESHDAGAVNPIARRQ